MPPIEMRPLPPVARPETRSRPADVRTETTASAVTPSRMASVSDALDPGAPPVDVERVAEIRRAIENGTYPVIPTRVADAMIAAGFLLQASK